MSPPYREQVRIFRAFCDENRLQILQLLRSGEKCACVLLEDLHISQSTLSHHMQILCDSGVVEARREGKWTHYSISETGSRRAAQLLVELLSPTGGLSCACGTGCENDEKERV